MAKGSSGFDSGGNGKGAKPLPELTGSEKQVKWANEIRDNALYSVNSVLERYESNIKNGMKRTDDVNEQIKAYEEIKKAITDTFMSVNEAKVIIDKRETFHPSRIHKIAGDTARARLAKKKK